MDRLAQLIEETTDVRELKRAVSVKLGERGMATEMISVLVKLRRNIKMTTAASSDPCSPCSMRLLIDWRM